MRIIMFILLVRVAGDGNGVCIKPNQSAARAGACDPTKRSMFSFADRRSKRIRGLKFHRFTLFMEDKPK